MATGRLPFERKTVGATFAAILHESPEPVTRCNSQLPVKLDDIVSKALQKRPAIALSARLGDLGSHARELLPVTYDSRWLRRDGALYPGNHGLAVIA